MPDRVFIAMAFAALAALATPAMAQKLPCFVVPLPGAQASTSDGPVAAARLSRDCASLTVTAGQVRVIYTNRDGDTLTPVVGTGERFAVPDASLADDPYNTLAAEIDPTLRRSGGTVGTKHFEPPTEAARKGLPHGTVYVPAAGLRFELAADLAAGSYTLVDRATQRPVASGPAAGGITLGRKQLTLGGEYEFQVKGGGALKSVFYVADADMDRSVTAALDRLARDTALDATSRRIALGLVYEQMSLAFNRSLDLREPRR